MTELKSARRTATLRAQHPTQHPLRLLLWSSLICALFALGYTAWESAYAAGATPPPDPQVHTADGSNPHPVHLQRPAIAPLSAVALLGKQIFYDTSLSGSGRMSCASCHSAEHAYGPPNDLVVQPGGVDMKLLGHRPPQSLMYLYRQPNFSVGPDDSENEGTVTVAQVAASSAGAPHAQKTVGAATSAVAMVPQGGLFWDGRADTLQSQAFGPLLNPVEMANTDIKSVAEKLNHTPYAQGFAQLFGASVLKTPNLLVSEAMFAVARYQVEEASFHPYSSKYDYWLEGRARLTPTELRGYNLFNNKDKANCAGCHLSQPSKDGLPPMFTDYQYEALGAPRNMAIAANHDPKFFDIGICGPDRADMKKEKPYCGMFLTPTLRNAATRKVFFHNGVFHTLEAVMDFYDFRDTDPKKVYPIGANGKPQKYNDLPAKYRANADVTDPPFDRKLGEKPAMTAQDMKDIIAFMKTLNDGYQAEPASVQASK